MFALENPLAVDVDAPLALRLALVWRVCGRGRGEVRGGGGLVEVPPQTGPEHHGDLAGWGAGGFEVVAGGVRDGGDEEVVVPKARLPEAVHMVSLCGEFFRFQFQRVGGWGVDIVHSLRVGGGGGVRGDVVVFLVFAVQDDGPAGGEDGVVGAEVVGFEEEAAEDGLDGEGLSVGEVHYRGRHGCGLGEVVVVGGWCMLLLFLWTLEVACLSQDA